MKNAPKITGLAFTFDDILIVPLYSAVLPQDVDTCTKLTRNIDLKIPFISAPMDTVTESKMAIEMARLGGVGVIHRNMKKEEEALQIKKVKKAKATKNCVLGKDDRLLVGGAVGVADGEISRVKYLVEVGCDFVVIDTSHGHSQRVGDFVKRVKDKFPDTDVIAGNVATEEGAFFLIKAGSDAVKVGIGPGSICTTRTISGAGVPQASAIMNVRLACQEKGIPMIADGGIKTSGDIVKAIGLGANSVMMGNIFAGCDESSSKLVEKEGVKYKYFRGMGSISALKKGSGDRYGGGAGVKMVAEGIEALTLYTGALKDVMFKLVWGLRSGMGYVGAKNIEELREKAKFYQITGMGLRESRAHDVKEL
ncbi:MAG: IMP dehydrogenase [Caldisericota bacterium]|nr:IMP dehydrogenase [Caldisericota bacterium]